MKPTTVALAAVILALVVLAGVLGFVAYQRGQDLAALRLELTAAKSAEKAWKEKYNAITKTPAADLVDSSPRADELAGARDELAAGLTDAVRARVREILSGGPGSPSP